MKRTVVIVCLLIIQAFGMISCTNKNSGSNSSVLFAQATNDTQRIVGTWTDPTNEIVFIFNANGTYSVTVAKSNPPEKINGDFILNASKLILHSSGNRIASIHDYYFSTNGNILVFNYTYSLGNYTRSGNLWLIKQ